jgi:hypothetical protein
VSTRERGREFTRHDVDIELQRVQFDEGQARKIRNRFGDLHRRGSDDDVFRGPIVIGCGCLPLS